MRTAVGPFLTTGAALVAATAVVANPVMTPPADVQIPAVELSANTGMSGDMFDRVFLAAIAPTPPESTSPLAVLRELLASLAGDANHVGREAIAQAFVAGAAVMAKPPLTALSVPNLAAPDVYFRITAPTVDTLPALVSVSQDVMPVLQQALSNLEEDATYVGGQVVVAAFAAGAVVAAEPELIDKTLTALAAGDIKAALKKAKHAVVAPLRPPLIIIDALRDVIEKRLAELHDLIAALIAAPTSAGAAMQTLASPPAAAITSPSPAAPPTSAPVVGAHRRPARTYVVHPAAGSGHPNAR